MKKDMENEYVFVNKWQSSIQVYDKIAKTKTAYWNHMDNRFNNLLSDFVSKFDENMDLDYIDNLMNELKFNYNTTFNKETHKVKKIPRAFINTTEELEIRLNEIKDKPINIRIKSPNSWNTVNRNNIPLVLKHSVVKCDGHYTDDYAYDNAVNFGITKFEDITASDGCKRSILNDVQHNLEGFIKLYWDNKDKEFVIYYGQWLSYSAKPTDGLKINFKGEVSEVERVEIVEKVEPETEPNNIIIKPECAKSCSAYESDGLFACVSEMCPNYCINGPKIGVW